MHAHAVLFDAAGTLLHVREPVGVTYARYACAAGVAAEPDRLDSAFRATLRRMPPMVFPAATRARSAELERAWWRDLVRATFAIACPEARFDDFDRFFEPVFHHFSEAGAWTLVPPAHAVLAALRARDIRTGIVSNFDQRLHGLLGAFGLTPLLDTVVLPADAGAAKPDPRIFTVALRRLEVDPPDAVYVGDDAEDDIAGAAGAGLQAIDVRALPDLTALLERINHDL
jgi:putative hydrolase of the HAD superfamily